MFYICISVALGTLEIVMSVVYRFSNSTAQVRVYFIGKYRWIFLKATTISDLCHGAILLTKSHDYEYRAYFKKVLVIPDTYITDVLISWN